MSITMECSNHREKESGEPTGSVRALACLVGGRLWRLWRVSVLLLVMGGGVASGGDLKLEMEWAFGGRPLRAGEPIARRGQEISMARADFLLSELALLREDGTWLSADPEWAACFRLDGKSAGTLATGVPEEVFRGLRFRVGVGGEIDRSDPSTREPESALHPDTCGLHWGWLGGYVYFALEGHWWNPQGQRDGFSYHLANGVEGIVEIPIRFDGRSPTTLRLALDLEKMLGEIDFVRDGTSTHSREGDPLAARMMARTAGAFRVLSVENDIYHESDVAVPAALPATATPYRFAATRRFPRVALPADNPLSVEGVALGRRIFEDPRLSVNGSQSCASCHDAGHAFSDPRPVSIGAEGVSGTRNSMPLFNLAWSAGSGYFWDGRAATLREQVLMPVTDAHEMNESLERAVAKLSADTAYPGEFAHAFGSEGIDADRIARALEQFLLSLVSQESTFDRAVRKLDKLTPQEQRGLNLFVTEYDPAQGLKGADCFHCHGGTLFTDHRFTSNGLDLEPGDIGRMAVTGDPADLGKFKTPSLRNVARTAPYMHDGRFATLEEVVEHYATGVRRNTTLDPNLAKHPPEGLDLSADDKAALVAFLRTLTDASDPETAKR